ncbi:MAG: hypothetical protein AB4060_15935 [Crocosphaera sp.]
MNKILPEKLEKLNKLITSIQNDLVMIKCQSEEYREILKAAQSKYQSEIEKTDDFWWLHLLSVGNHITLLLSKVYDNHGVENSDEYEIPDYTKRVKEVITLHSLIYFVEKNLKPCDRLQNIINLNKKQIYTKTDDLVEKLNEIRDNIIAHKNKRQFFQSEEEGIQSLTWDELDKLVQRGFDICHIYGEYYNNGKLNGIYENYGSSVIPHTKSLYFNDYKKVLKALKIKNIAYNFLDKIDNIDKYPDDVKAFREEFDRELKDSDN